HLLRPICFVPSASSHLLRPICFVPSGLLCPTAVDYCPGCSGGKRFNFSERAEKLFLDGVDYYQVVFTYAFSDRPEQRQPLGDLLFSSAWKSLWKTIGNEQGYVPAAIVVLHTWNQKLDSHWHVHAIVPGAGPEIDQEAGRPRRLLRAVS
ncbi:MAG: transposase, partial [Planctomycetales bacterium]|nr:transposase [Planctomycetales bacterium]